MADALYYQMTDILLSYDTDLAFEKGDLMLTSGNDYIEREIYKLLITEPGDWKSQLNLGCSPIKFAGEQNTRDTASKLQQYIADGLSFTVAPAQVKVRAVPTNYDTILIFIDIYSPAALELTIPFVFNYNNGIVKLDRADPRTVIPQSSPHHTVNDITNLKKHNKYVSRLRDNSLSNLI